MIGVVIPAHNEETLLPYCLASVIAAARHPQLTEPVQILLVLDSCTDGSAQVARQMGIQTLATEGRNVGEARCAGAAALIAAGARWLAFTDADTVVSPQWLIRQLAFQVDAVCGTVSVDSWQEHSPQVQARYEHLYQAVEGHRHIHGANLGVCSIAYQRAGGFRPLPAHEDVHLVRDLERAGARIVWTATNSVITSARKHSRCREGFADYLLSLAMA
ncbi:glycosyltransferase [Pseudomonas sp. B2M1-30]|uniref:Glycosyltransferase n=1 Tax=Pseudomonas koreensis TaxID=198620 RepID=A0A9X2XIT0_9PSED|nr:MULTISPECIES: glycosyltransferase [Pseudomonas]MBV4477682.1 glycosyltransferase [Pseudomonas botevensis]MCU0120076.1 glycosyltransferase [Pseudomonas sp. B2M1-30]MCU7249835.1 glycosyltransferase [Pseudomonas koreensis]MCU7262087.1 glycosyltransferase [Pseudomonas koreensis]